MLIGEGGEKLRLRAAFEAVVELATEGRDFFDDLLLLVDFDGVDAAILALVLGGLDGVLKGCIEEFDSACLLYTSPSPRDRTRSRMPSSA